MTVRKLYITSARLSGAELSTGSSLAQGVFPVTSKRSHLFDRKADLAVLPESSFPNLLTS
jgi:hypothetical protein